MYEPGHAAALDAQRVAAATANEHAELEDTAPPGAAAALDDEAVLRALLADVTLEEPSPAVPVCTATGLPCDITDASGGEVTLYTLIEPPADMATHVRTAFPHVTRLVVALRDPKPGMAGRGLRAFVSAEGGDGEGVCALVSGGAVATDTALALRAYLHHRQHGRVYVTQVRIRDRSAMLPRERAVVRRHIGHLLTQCDAVLVDETSRALLVDDLSTLPASAARLQCFLYTADAAPPGFLPPRADAVVPPLRAWPEGVPVDAIHVIDLRATSLREAEAAQERIEFVAGRAEEGEQLFTATTLDACNMMAVTSFLGKELAPL